MNTPTPIITDVNEAKILINYITERNKQIVSEHPEIKCIDVTFNASKEVIEQLAKDFEKVIHPPTGGEGTFDVFLHVDKCCIRFQSPWYKATDYSVRYEIAN